MAGKGTQGHASGSVLWVCWFMAAILSCAEASAFTEAIISDETNLQGSTNEISVRLYSNADLGIGKQITLSGFIGSNTGAASLSLKVENGTVRDTAEWERTAGVLTVTLARDVSRSQSIKLRFTLVNPEADNNASSITISCTDCAADGSALASLTKETSSLLQVLYEPATCLSKRKYGDGNCDLLCQGIVKGSVCFCMPGQFGTGCSRAATVVEEASSVVDSSAAATSILLSGGQGLQLPAGAVRGTSKVEISVKLYSLVPQPGAGEELYGAGRAMAVGPRGLVLARQGSLALDLSPALVYSGFSPAALMRIEATGKWARLAGSATETAAIPNTQLQVSIGAGSRIGSTLAAMAVEDEPAVAPAFTEALLGAETHLQGSTNEISARVFCSWPLRAGAEVTLSGLTGSRTPDSARFPLVVDVDPGTNQTLAAVGRWSQAQGVLTVTLQREVAAKEGLAVRFTLLNPSSDADASQPARVTVACVSCLVVPSAFSFLRMAPLSIASDVLRVTRFQAPQCAAVGRYGEGCTRVCRGVVRGSECVCTPGRFGADCEVQGTLLARASGLYDPASSSPLRISIPGNGPSLLISAKALTNPDSIPRAGAWRGQGRVEVSVKLYSVQPQPHFSQPGLVPSGRAVVLGPAASASSLGFDNLNQATLTLDLQPPSDGLPLTVAAFRLGEGQVWEEEVGGRVVRGGRGLQVQIGALGTHTVFRFERHLAPRVTAAFLRGGSSVQGQPSQVSARVRLNCNLAPGSRLTLSGLTDSLSRSTPALPLRLPPRDPSIPAESTGTGPPPSELESRGPIPATGEWDQTSGRLVLTLAEGVPSNEDIAWSFSILNPLQTKLGATVSVSCPGCNAYTHPPAPLGPLTVATNVMAVHYVASGCEEPRMFGFDCSLGCEGVVAGKLCLCAPNRFGDNCSQAGSVVEERTVVVDNEADATLTLTGGEGVTIQAGALPAGTQSEVAMTLYDVYPLPKPEQTLVPTGRVAVLAPHGLRFLKPVTLRLEHDPARVPPGFRPSVHWLNPGTKDWEDVGGRLQVGLFTTEVAHFSTFAVMAAPLPATPPPSTPDAALEYPLLGQKPADDGDVSAGVIYAAIFGAVAVVGGVCVCLGLRRRRNQQAQEDRAQAGSVYQVPGHARAVPAGNLKQYAGPDPHWQGGSGELSNARALQWPEQARAEAQALAAQQARLQPAADRDGLSAAQGHGPHADQLAALHAPAAALMDLEYQQAQLQQAQLQQAQFELERIAGLAAPPACPPGFPGRALQGRPAQVFSDMDGTWYHATPPSAGGGGQEGAHSMFTNHLPPVPHASLRAPPRDGALLGGQRDVEVWDV